jgi:hypothetical protein
VDVNRPVSSGGFTFLALALALARARALALGSDCSEAVEACHVLLMRVEYVQGGGMNTMRLLPTTAFPATRVFVVMGRGVCLILCGRPLSALLCPSLILHTGLPKERTLLVHQVPTRTTTTFYPIHQFSQTHPSTLT